MKRLRVLVVVLILASGCVPGQTQVSAPKGEPGATKGGTLTVGITEPVSIDPGKVSAHDPAGALVVRTMCDQLLTYDPVTGKPALGLIKEEPRVTDGGQSTFVLLRRGVKFSDGSELHAEDVTYSLSRVAAREFNSPAAEVVSQIRGYEGLRGGDDLQFEKQTTGALLSGLVESDPYSFEVRTVDDTPGDYSAFLSHPAATPVSKKAVESDPAAFARKPVCVGPYRMTKPWEPGSDVIELERDPNYYAASTAFSNGGAGYADRIAFRIYADRNSAYEAMRRGEVQIAPVPVEAIPEAREAGVDLKFGITPTLEYIGLPNNQAPFDQRATRVALSQALDRKAIVEAVYNDGRQPARSMLPPAVGEAYREDACRDLAPVSPNVDGARELLSSAGIDLTGKQIKLQYNDDPGKSELMKMVGDQWTAAFGLQVELAPQPWDEYLNTATSRTGFEGAFRMSWPVEVPSPDRYLTPLLSSASIGLDNLSNFSDTRFDRILRLDARKATEPTAIAEEYQRLEDLACNLMPIIPLAYGGTYYAVAPEVGAARRAMTDRSSGDVLLREVYLR